MWMSLVFVGMRIGKYDMTLRIVLALVTAIINKLLINWQKRCTINEFIDIKENSLGI
jgi:hypothetical protein